MNHKMTCWVPLLIASVWLSSRMSTLEGRHVSNNFHPLVSNDDSEGTRWAVLVAGSNGFGNYRHQADICHAYQIMKNGGLKDENIIVFMSDDIANNEENPRPGVIINHPNGSDVYKGVPKDYTGNYTSAENLYAVISGNQSAITGGSGKMLNSGPNDTIFIYYADHGGPGIIGMPVGDFVVANDFIDVLKSKHAANAYKKMVIYLEACESGSMFEGILPENINIYVTTASNANESSWGCYCPGDPTYPPPPEFQTCLGDSYSVLWMEDSDKNDRTKETLQQQYETVREKTLDWEAKGSHVMQYGNKNFTDDFLVTYIGATGVSTSTNAYPSSATPTKFVDQRDALLHYLSHKFKNAPEGSKERMEAQKGLIEEIAQREHVDNSVKAIADHLFGEEYRASVISSVRPSGQPLVDDWDCFKNYIKIYESYCGALSTYGRKYTRAIANICNAGVSQEKMVVASSLACP
ncbi:vacuolar-processing enzyme [Arachis duranensis]|uniref:Vacuolar-processing enzyme n=1 Tax=Arachis duranensis TaxID=130453 RepID=A0A6P4DZ84_ARADU|nr:vacuolar-processing enzyme [Arachis duranensis]